MNSRKVVLWLQSVLVLAALGLSGSAFAMNLYSAKLRECYSVIGQQIVALEQLPVLETKQEVDAAVDAIYERFPYPTFLGFQVCGK